MLATLTTSELTGNCSTSSTGINTGGAGGLGSNEVQADKLPDRFSDFLSRKPASQRRGQVIKAARRADLAVVQDRLTYRVQLKQGHALSRTRTRPESVVRGCLRNISNIRDGLGDDVVTYGLQPHPNDPDRKITKFNFFGDAMPRIKNAGKRELDEALHSLYQGKQIINEALREETGGYIKSFISADITAPPDADTHSVNIRYRRALFVYKCSPSRRRI